MENNRIKGLLNQLDAPEFLQEDLINITKQSDLKRNQTQKIRGGRASYNILQKQLTKAVAATLIGIFAIGGITTGAIYLHKWTKSLGDGLVSSKKEQKQLEEKGATDFPELTQTVDGVTVSLQQSLVDSNIGYLSFTVKGFDIKSGDIPNFESSLIQVGDEEPNYETSFYNHITADKLGKMSYIDGSDLEYDKDNQAIGKYMDEEGYMEYNVIIKLNDNLEKQMRNDTISLVDKKVHIEFTNLGHLDSDKKMQTDVEGTWIFDYTLKGVEQNVEKTVNQKVGNSVVNISNVKLSPLSIRVQGELNISYEEAKDGILNNSGIFPTFFGVKYKDGSVLYIGSEHGNGGCDDTGVYREFVGVSSNVIDVENVDSLLYVDGPYQNVYERGYVPPTKDRMVEVKLR